MSWPIGLRLRTSGTTALPGYSVFIVPWAGEKATSGSWARGQSSTYLGGGIRYNNVPATTDYIEWDIWLDAGTYKVAHVGGKGPTHGVLSHKLNGVEKATMDLYAAAQTLNNYIEAAGIAITAGLYTYRVGCPTKNASSTNYETDLQSLAWIRTGA